MLIYDYVTADCVEVSDSQYDFIQAMIKHSGRMDEVRKEYPITDEQLATWKADPVFWPVVDSYIRVLIKARGLSPEYIKSYLLSTIEGKQTPTREQMQAINTSVRALGMGLQPRLGFQGKFTVSPENTTIEFADGLSGENNNK